jgi:hypothetical protein
MAFHGLENTRHKGQKELNKPYESKGKLNPLGTKVFNGSKNKSNLI